MIVIKTMNTYNENNTTNSTMPAAACTDCLFWYRCRGAKLDCLFRTPLAPTSSIRA